MDFTITGLFHKPCDRLRLIVSDLKEQPAPIFQISFCIFYDPSVKIKSVFFSVQSDLFEKIEEKYDVIVSNPPYIQTEVIEGLQEEVRLHDPYIALDGKEDGLYFYRRIIEDAKAYLEDGGWLLFKIINKMQPEPVHISSTFFPSSTLSSACSTRISVSCLGIRTCSLTKNSCPINS